MREERRATRFYVLAVLHIGCFALFYGALWQAQLAGLEGPARNLWWLKISLEILASFYFFSALLKSLNYLLAPSMSERAAEGGGDAWNGTSLPPIACLYLCAGDLDPHALHSLVNLDYPGRFHVYVHDDSGDEPTAERVDECAQALARRAGPPVFVLRRRNRTGGKPGAVNYVLSRLGNRYPFILLADNDSTAVDRQCLLKTLPLLEDPKVAAVQFRNVSVDARGERPVNRLLRRAIEVFDLFAWHQSRHGISLFLGHNAVLMTAALDDAGGLREGTFADDIDLSVRLLRRGWRILYAPDIPFGETHPTSYASFRRRAYKWAFGCGQILRRHLLPVLLDRRLSFAQKLGFLDFAGFYGVQALLILYLILAGLIIPAVMGPATGQSLALFVSGLAVVLSIFLPSLVFHARHGRMREWWPFGLVCALVYGSVAFASARGVLEGLLGRRRSWVPTNLDSGARRLSPALVAESLFGLSLVVLPAWWGPEMLWQPSLYLFAAVFFLVPVVQTCYVPCDAGRSTGSRAWVWGRILPGIARRERRGAWFWLSLFAGGVLTALLLTARGGTAHAQGPHSARVSIEGPRLLVDGSVFLVKGVHYSPWLPGTGPMKSYPWPGKTIVAKDLEMIRSLGANTILVHDAPPWIFPLARHFDLMVIESFFINWQSIGDDAIFEARSAEIERQSAEISREPNLLAILLGNEVLEWVLKERGAPFIEDRLHALYDRVKQVAPRVPIGHANRPIARQLRLPFMDLACFNLYPAWPREVVVAGYGNYIENVLKPDAAGRPLLITEFGQNSLEATEQKQGQVLRESWEEIRARTAGGVVFEFADEWWKNYDNPVQAGEWWQRTYAPNDEAVHDLDPEEYYGIVTSERDPKPAFEVVRQMYTPQTAVLRRIVLCSLPLLSLFAYTLYVFRKGQ